MRINMYKVLLQWVLGSGVCVVQFRILPRHCLLVGIGIGIGGVATRLVAVFDLSSKALQAERCARNAHMVDAAGVLYGRVPSEQLK